LLTPEFQVVLLPQQKAYQSDLASIQSVNIVISADGQERVIEAAGTRAAEPSDLAPYGLGTTGGVTIARFPLSVVVAGSRLRVTFSDVLRGSSALTNCKECVVPLAVMGLK